MTLQVLQFTDPSRDLIIDYVYVGKEIDPVARFDFEQEVLNHAGQVYLRDCTITIMAVNQESVHTILVSCRLLANPDVQESRLALVALPSRINAMDQHEIVVHGVLRFMAEQLLPSSQSSPIADLSIDWQQFDKDAKKWRKNKPS